MAPELVQEQPYNHSVDIWSYGIILYELFAGQPPFYTNNLYSLIKMIVKNSVKYPDNMSSEFKSFLKGLLVKEPSKRMTWPEILEHPFLRANNSDLDEEKKIRKKYNNWLRQVGQWNKDFAEFKSSKIDFFTSEIYTYDEFGFTGHNANITNDKKKSKKGSSSLKANEGKNLDILSVDNVEETFTKLVKNKGAKLNTFMDKFAEMCSKLGSKKDSGSLTAREIEKICQFIKRMFQEAPDLFETKRKAVAILVKQLRLFMDRLKDPKYVTVRIECVLVCLLISDLKNVSKIILTELTKILQITDKPSLKVSLELLHILKLLFKKMQSDFTESQEVIQGILSQKILQVFFSRKRAIISEEVLNSDTGRLML